VNTIARAIEGIGVRRRSDVHVFERALQGDPVAFSEVYRRYYDRVFAFCLSRLLSREAAKDAAQESFVRALSANASGVTSPVSWLFGIARHVCIDVAREAARSQPAHAADVQSDESALPVAKSAEDTALSKQDASKVLVALRKTNPRYRSALILREIHQQPMPDVAEALGVNVGTAYTILSRARDAFGKSYAEVLNLPAPCSRAIELSYRDTGTGLTPAETTVLETHLTSCAKCRREAARVDGSNRLKALLLLTPWASPRTPNLLDRAVAAVGSRPWPTHALPETGVVWTVPKVAAVAIAAINLVSLAGPTGPQPAPSDNNAAFASTCLASQDVSSTCSTTLGGALSPSNGAASHPGAPVTQRSQVQARLGSGGTTSASGGKTAKRQRTGSAAADGTGSGSGQSGGPASSTARKDSASGSKAVPKGSGGSSTASQGSRPGGSPPSGSGSGGSSGATGGSGNSGGSSSGGGSQGSGSGSSGSGDAGSGGGPAQ
jgi:RNA polymerase sigma factor (sigma-70 family)